MAIYQWQSDDYNYLLQLKDRLPHTILLHGPRGLGTLKLAYSFIYSLLCITPNPNGSYCGKCNSCVLLEDASHPDFYSLNVAEEEKFISIAAVRASVDFLSLSTHISKYKIVLIENANLLNLSSANALLKILEEPPSHALFIILSDNIQQILPTILSRSHKYQVSIPSRATAVEFLASKNIPNLDFWLAYYNNCPLFEAEIDEAQLQQLIKVLCEPGVENIYSLTIEFDGKQVSFAFILEFLGKWLSDLVSCRLSGEFNYFNQYATFIEPLISKLQLDKAFYLQDRLNYLANWTNHPLNFKLQIENLLFQYQQIFVK